MGKEDTAIGANTREVLEDIPAALAAQFLEKVIDAVEGNDAVPSFTNSVATDRNARLTPEELDHLGPELLSEVEVQSQRVTEMGCTKGAESLKTIVNEMAPNDVCELFDQQLDDLCRSCWSFIKLPIIFQNAESFHHARKDRDRGNIHSAFTLDLDESVPATTSSVNFPALTRKLDQVLGLGRAPTLSAIDLPETETYPASVMLIVRHGADLSSVYEHRDDGSRHPHYFRPQDEIVLIYTPLDQKIEVLGRSFGQRHDVSNAFAEIVLGHNISEKPLSEKVYDLGRFASSFELDVPEIEGVDVQSAVVTECELLLGSFGRRASLKVTREDDIDDMLKRYLSGARRFRGPAGISRIAISVKYRRAGERRNRSLNITLRGTNGSNVQSHKDRATRELGARLLEAWGITRKLRPLDEQGTADWLPTLMRLFDLGETVVTGLRLSELGLSIDTLLDARLISQKKRQSLTLIEDDEDDVVEVDASSVIPERGHSVLDYTEFKVADAWLRETLARSLARNLSARKFEQISDDLVRVGDISTDNGSAPVYLARGLGEPKVIFKLEEDLRSRGSAGDGLVLCAGPEAPRFLANNVAMPVEDVWHTDSASPGLIVDHMLDRLNSERRLIAQNTQARVVRGGPHTGSLVMPHKEALPLSSPVQMKFFEKLVTAYNAGAPDVHSSFLVEGTSARTPREIFTGKMRERVFGSYVVRGNGKGMWRLMD